MNFIFDKINKWQERQKILNENKLKFSIERSLKEMEYREFQSQNFKKTNLNMEFQESVPQKESKSTFERTFKWQTQYPYCSKERGCWC